MANCYNQPMTVYDDAGRNSCYDKAGLNSCYNKAGRNSYYNKAGRIGILLRILHPAEMEHGTDGAWQQWSACTKKSSYSSLDFG